MAPVVAYQGVPGAYSEAASRQLLGKEIEAIGLDSFDKCFQALDSNRAQFAMLPIENSMGGSIHDNIDLQLRHDFYIVAELDFRVRHCIMALPGETFESIKTVISHPQALAQCDQYLRKKGLQPLKEYDTAGSAKKISEEKLKGYGAIASELAAEYFSLNILDRGIEDDPNNVTRFLLLSKKSLIPRAPKDRKSVDTSMKTSIVFSLIDVPGVLFTALAAFSLRNLDLTKIESRPDRFKKTGHFLTPLSSSSSGRRRSSIGSEDGAVSNLYVGMPAPPTMSPRPNSNKNSYRTLFYIDVIGSTTDEPMANALCHLAEISPFLRILGCYPVNGVLQQHVADALGTPDNTRIGDKNDGAPQKKKPKLEAKIEKSPVSKASKLKIAIVGFGNFGQFLAKTFVKHADVVACNRTDYSVEAAEIGVGYYNDPKSMLESNRDVDVLVISVAILAFEKIVSILPMDLLDDILVVDVLSVKMFAKTVLMASLPKDSGILCTHPMFGPESGKYSWNNLPMVYDRVRLVDEATKSERKNPKTMSERSSMFLDIFVSENCSMVDMTCEEHDRQSADSQFVTHFTGRMINRLNLGPTAIATTGFKSLLTLRDQTVKDSFDLFSALYMCNPNAENTLLKMRNAMNDLIDDLKSNKSKLHIGNNGNAGDSTQEMDRLSSFVNKIGASKTGETFGLATKLKEEGKDIVMSLCVGEPDFPPPKPILDAAVQALNEGKTRYTPVQGILELRKEIARDLAERKNVTVDPNNILITSGGKQAIFCALLALCDKGDQVVVPAPYWVSYPEIVKLSGAEPVILRRNPANNYIMSPMELSAVLTPRTRVIILCNPCNPTGCLYSRADLEAIAAQLSRPEYSHVYVLADEIYERLTYDGAEHVSFASLPGMAERTLIVSGFAKAYAMTGFRLGYLTAPPKILKAALKLQSQMNSCANSISQYAGVRALKLTQAELQPLYDELEQKRDLVVSRLEKIPDITCSSAKGAFYAFPSVGAYIGSNVRDPHENKSISSSTDLCQYLIKHYGVVLVAGDAFGAPNGIRLSFATSMKDINDAIDRLEKGLAALVRN